MQNDHLNPISLYLTMIMYYYDKVPNSYHVVFPNLDGKNENILIYI
jgi:hypothetical protein